MMTYFIDYVSFNQNCMKNGAPALYDMDNVK